MRWAKQHGAVMIGLRTESAGEPLAVNAIPTAVREAIEEAGRGSDSSEEGVARHAALLLAFIFVRVSGHRLLGGRQGRRLTLDRVDLAIELFQSDDN